MNEIIKKNGIYYGIIIGLVAVSFQVIIYATGNDLYKSTIAGLLVTLLYWSIRIYQSVAIKKQLKNLITFKEAFTALLISTTIGILISVVFNFLFYNFIATELKPEINDFMNSSQLEIYKILGKSSKQINDLMKNDNFSISNLFKGAIFSIVISSIFNLILAAIFKSKTSNQL